MYFYGRFGTERKGLATIHGILTAVGEILGGIIFGMLGHRFTGRLEQFFLLFTKSENSAKLLSA
jgi:hypothetical protein